MGCRGHYEFRVSTAQSEGVAWATKPRQNARAAATQRRLAEELIETLELRNHIPSRVISLLGFAHAVRSVGIQPVQCLGQLRIA
jgi:hypothetical protein